mmetsp:Transcript_109504/g.283084  ORF Transcript_109504/g.283084 Transcript_109504/m.283084 type:complete len:240 (+) Transcript_109504:1036-1755(+)
MVQNIRGFANAYGLKAANVATRWLGCPRSPRVATEKDLGAEDGIVLDLQAVVLHQVKTVDLHPLPDARTQATIDASQHLRVDPHVGRGREVVTLYQARVQPMPELFPVARTVPAALLGEAADEEPLLQHDDGDEAEPERMGVDPSNGDAEDVEGLVPEHAVDDLPEALQHKDRRDVRQTQSDHQQWHAHQCTKQVLALLELQAVGPVSLLVRDGAYRAVPARHRRHRHDSPFGRHLCVL